MTTQELIDQIRKKKSFLCIGLDVDIQKIPPHLLKTADPIFEFNKAIIEATHHLCVAYKPNTAFYEAYGIKGWMALEKTINYINENYPELFTIADAKRGDIGNTSSMYAKAFFEDLNFDSITVAPYMGSDSVEPFLAFENKWAIVLGLTSNQGAFDFQMKGHPELYKEVLKEVSSWGTKENTMFVIGATRADQLQNVRNILPHHFLLIPGVGAQGGDVATVCEHALTDDGGILINVSRGIIYASSQEDFASKAQEAAKMYQQEMQQFIK